MPTADCFANMNFTDSGAVELWLDSRRSDWVPTARTLPATYQQLVSRSSSDVDPWYKHESCIQGLEALQRLESTHRSARSRRFEQAYLIDSVHKHTDKIMQALGLFKDTSLSSSEELKLGSIGLDLIRLYVRSDIVEVAQT